MGCKVGACLTSQKEQGVSTAGAHDGEGDGVGVGRDTVESLWGIMDNGQNSGFLLSSYSFSFHMSPTVCDRLYKIEVISEM